MRSYYFETGFYMKRNAGLKWIKEETFPKLLNMNNHQVTRVSDGFNVYQHLTSEEDIADQTKEIECESKEVYLTRIRQSVNGGSLSINKISDDHLTVHFGIGSSKISMACYLTTAVERKELFKYIFLRMADKISKSDETIKNLEDKVTELEKVASTNSADKTSGIHPYEPEFKRAKQMKAKPKRGSSIINPGARSSITRPENDLLRLVYDTQSTLMGAAHALHSQGQQLSNASRIMNNLNVDLAVADRITKDLESYFGAWRCKKQFEKPKVKIEERHGSPLDNDRIEYKVLIGKFVQNTHTDGYLIIGKNAVELLDEKSKILYAFKAGQISNLNVHSPWDVTLIQSYIGRPDVKVHLISTQMPVILRLLENFTRCKANLDDVPEGTAFVDEITSFDEVDGKEISENDKHRENAVNLCPQSSSLRQKQKKQSALSEEETGEISTVLRSMKKLATDIAAEQDLQLQQIDVLNKSVERANSQIKQTDSKVKKMT